MNLEFYLIRMDRLFEDYAADAQELERNRKPNELFGLKFGPTDDPRHDRFADELAALLSDFVAEDPESGAVRAVIEKLYGAAKRYTEPKSAYWMLVAAQGLITRLVPGLDRADAAALAADYDKLWPRRARLPVQDEVLRQLKKAAKQPSP